MKLKFKLERFGTLGSVLAAAACPICFPKLALLGAMLGLGALAPYETWFAVVAQISLLLALVGHVIAYRRHRKVLVLALAGAGVAAVLGSLWIHYLEAVVYLGLGATVVATVWSVFALRTCASCVADDPEAGSRPACARSAGTPAAGTATPRPAPAPGTAPSRPRRRARR